MLKSIAKKWIPENHWLYISWYKENFGLFPALHSYFGLLRNQGIGTAPNPFTGGVVFLRPGTTDQDVYDQIFLIREYDLELGDPRFIVDAGAHIGMSAVFFASKYPDATVVAIEPEPSNFEILSRNACEYGNIKTIQAGLWSRKTHLRILDSRVDTWSFRVLEDDSGQGIPAVGIQEILSDFDAGNMDVLKIDIEGSEVEVLNNAQSWIDSVGVLFIELHDRFRPGCTKALYNALEGHDFEESLSGESVVLKNIRRKEQSPATKG
jgi:FkbM family methyltransferase